MGVGADCITPIGLVSRRLLILFFFFMVLGIITAINSRKALIEEFDNVSKISIRSTNEKRSVQALDGCRSAAAEVQVGLRSHITHFESEISNIAS